MSAVATEEEVVWRKVTSKEELPEKDGWYFAYNKGQSMPLLIQIFHEGDERRFSRYEFQKVSSRLTEKSFTDYFGPVADPPRKPV